MRSFLVLCSSSYSDSYLCLAWREADCIWKGGWLRKLSIDFTNLQRNAFITLDVLPSSTMFHTLAGAPILRWQLGITKAPIVLQGSNTDS